MQTPIFRENSSSESIQNVKIRFGMFAIPSTGPLNLIEQGIMAEKTGFDSVWVGDHFIDENVNIEYAEPFTTLAIIGEKTKSINIATGVTDPFRRHPATIAQTIANLDIITQGRVILGLGAGEAMNLIPFGIDWSAPIAKLKEAIEIIRLLWSASSERPSDYKGNFYHLKNAFLQVKPSESPLPPIYVGALGKRTRELTGEVADGWLPWINSLQSFKIRLEDVKNGAKKAERKLSQIDIGAVLPIAISKDIEKAKKALGLVSKMALVCERDILDMAGYNMPRDFSIQNGLYTKKRTQELMQLAEEVPWDLVDQISAYGSPSECMERIREFIKAGATHIVFFNLSPDLDYSLKVIKNKILPYFRES